MQESHMNIKSPLLQLWPGTTIEDHFEKVGKMQKMAGDESK